MEHALEQTARAGPRLRQRRLSRSGSRARPATWVLPALPLPLLDQPVAWILGGAERLSDDRESGQRMFRNAFKRAAACGLVLALAAAPAPSARAEEGEGRCWIALRITGPEANRVSEEEARRRLRESCRAGDALVFLTDTGQPFGPVVALYCDMARPFLVERPEDWLPPPSGGPRPPVRILTCTYRGGARPDR